MISPPENTHVPHRIHAQLTGYVWLISLVAALGGLLFGYDWVVIGGAKPFYERYFALDDPSQQGWAMSCALVGCLLGAVACGALSDKFGRKRLLILSATLFAISSIGTALAHTFAGFVAWRIAGGAAIGLASNLSPMYIAEVSPASIRGRLVSVNQLNIVIGILLAQVANWLIAEKIPAGATAAQVLASWNGQNGWRWMFGVTAIPSLLFFAGMFLVPESPRWLAKKGRLAEARRILAKIGGEAYAAQEVREVEATLVNEVGKVDFRELFEPRVLRVLLLGVTIAVYSQWCGINVIFNYSEEIFRAAGYDLSDVLKNIAWIGSVNLVFTFVAIGLVDRWGRKLIMALGSAGLGAVYLALGACYHAGVQGWPLMVLVLAAIAMFAMSIGPVSWVLISELFPNRIRGAATSVAVSALWVACFILTYTFPLLKNACGAAGTFWVYAGVCAAGLIFILACLPETKGKTLEQLERMLSGTE